MSGIFLPPNPTADQLNELIVLAAAMANNDTLDAMTLTPDDFENPLWGEAFGLMRQMHADRKPVTPGSLGSVWPKHLVLFHEIQDAVHAGETATWEFHADKVRANGTRRKLEQAAGAIVEMSRDRQREISSIEDDARKIVDAACGVKQGATELSGETAAEVIANIGKARKAVPTPWGGLTRIIRGFRPGGLYVLGARPAVGKSAIALQMARTLETYGHVPFFTLEMGRHEVTQRLIAQETEVPLSVIDGSSPMQPFMQSKIDQWHAGYNGRIAFDDTASITMAEIRSRVRTMSRTMPLSGIVIDYLQLVGGMRSTDDLRTHVTNLSREAKLLARDFDVPVIALSQLNRNSEHRADKRPAMSDLRESGSIEQDADVVILLHRDEDTEILEMIVAKNRQGPSMSTELMWHGEFTMALD